MCMVAKYLTSILHIIYTVDLILTTLWEQTHMHRDVAPMPSHGGNKLTLINYIKTIRPCAIFAMHFVQSSNELLYKLIVNTHIAPAVSPSVLLWMPH